jgi:hypothetical protein
MSRVSKKRLANQLASVVGQTRQRNELLLMGVAVSLGFIGSFLLNKIEWAAFFWAVALLCAADLLLTVGKLQKIGVFWRWVLNVTFVAIVWAFSYPYIHAVYRTQRAALTEGVLHTPSDGKDHSKDPPTFQLGESFRVTMDNPKMGGTVIQRWAGNVTMFRRGNEILVSTTVKDKEGHLIVEVRDNHWKVPNKETSWDKNYTDNALEVRDAQGRVVLQMRLLPDRVQFQAEWADRANHAVQTEHFSEEWGIAPMFKYPSSEHWGEFSGEYSSP